MTDFYDGPRRGVADFRGRAHLYVSRFADIDSDEKDVFDLYALDDRTFALAIEDWAIWLRWVAAFEARLVGIETHPALPQERARHDAIQAELTPRLAALREGAPAASAHARFKADTVSWQVVDEPAGG
jgi:hypothetical protein